MMVAAVHNHNVDGQVCETFRRMQPREAASDNDDALSAVLTPSGGRVIVHDRLLQDLDVRWT
jgi:hypothetical protein